jgi:hypothetical protein
VVGLDTAGGSNPINGRPRDREPAWQPSSPTYWSVEAIPTPSRRRTAQPSPNSRDWPCWPRNWRRAGRSPPCSQPSFVDGTGIVVRPVVAAGSCGEQQARRECRLGDGAEASQSAQTPSVDCIGAGSVQETRSGWHAVGSGPDVGNSRRRRPGCQRASPAACARRRGASRGRTDLSSSLPRREPGECLAVLTMIGQIGRAWGGPAPSRPGLAQNRNSAAIGRVDGSSASGSANASTSAS